MVLVANYYNAPPLPDIEAIKARVSLVETIAADVPLTRKGRDYWGLCPFHGEKTPSFKVDGSGGYWKCHGCGAGGDIFDYLYQSRGMDLQDARRFLAMGAGLIPNSNGYTKPLAKLRPIPLPDTRTKEAEDATREALAIWDQCGPITGTVAARYLESRAIHCPSKGWPSALCFHPGLEYAPAGLRFPAMVAGVENPDGEITGIIRTYLLPDGRGKARVSRPRLARGPRYDGAVRLASCDGTELGLAEGIETGLSAGQLFNVPTWAAGGTTMNKIAVPLRVSTVHVFADNGEAGLTAAHEAVESFTGQRRKVVLHIPPQEYGDWNDVLQARATT